MDKQVGNHMQSVKAYCKNNVSRFLYLHLHRIKYWCIFVGIVKPKIQFSFTFALTFHYICRISEAVRHSQAENVIFACLCAHLSLYLQQIRRQTTVISNHPTLCTTCRLSYILPCKTQGKRLNSEIPCSVCTKTVKTN